MVLGPLIAAGVIAGFLLLMVAMGLTGVLWQTVTQRTREIGLRRAKGATAGDIRTQILGELVVMTSIAVLAGVGARGAVPAPEADRARSATASTWSALWFRPRASIF